MEDEFGVKPEPFAGIQGAVAELDADELNQALEELAEPEVGREEIVTEVDGAPARVISGLSGGPLLDAEPVTDDSSVLQALTYAVEEEARYHSAAKKAANAWKQAKSRTQAAVSVAAEHYNQSRELSLDLTVGREGGEV